MINIEKRINETLLCFASQSDYEKLGSYEQLLNGLVLAVSNELAFEFNTINYNAAKNMGAAK